VPFERVKNEERRTRLDGPGPLEQPVGQGRLAMVDVRDDVEVADVRERNDGPREKGESEAGDVAEAAAEAGSAIEHRELTKQQTSNSLDRSSDSYRREAKLLYFIIKISEMAIPMLNVNFARAHFLGYVSAVIYLTTRCATLDFKKYFGLAPVKRF